MVAKRLRRMFCLQFWKHSDFPITSVGVLLLHGTQVVYNLFTGRNIDRSVYKLCITCILQDIFNYRGVSLESSTREKKWFESLLHVHSQDNNHYNWKVSCLLIRMPNPSGVELPLPMLQTRLFTLIHFQRRSTNLP